MISKATILGRIGKKEEKVSKSGNNLTVLSIATSRKWKNQAGEQQDETTWHTVNCFNKLAEIASKYAHVGNLIYIEGDINHRKKEAGNGEFKYFYSIVCTELKLIPGQKKPEENGNSCSFQNGNDSFDDSIPF